MKEPREVCFLIGRDEQVLWADVGPGPLALPDSRARWEAIWQARDQLEAIVHSHPVGPHAFSQEDLTTMAAVDEALGRKLLYLVLSPQGLLGRRGDDAVEAPAVEPPWVGQLRRLSNMLLETQD